MGKSMIGGVLAFVLVLGALSSPAAMATNDHNNGRGNAHGHSKHDKKDDKHEYKKNHDRKDRHGKKDKEQGNHVAVTICHKTGSRTNPYVVITVDDDSITHGKGHAKHHKHGDIIPSFTDDNGKNYPGLNWNSRTEAIHKNGCKTAPVTPVEQEEEDCEETPVKENPVKEVPVQEQPEEVEEEVEETPAPVTPNDNAPTTPEVEEEVEEVKTVETPESLPQTGSSSVAALVGVLLALATTAAGYAVRAKLSAKEQL